MKYDMLTIRVIPLQEKKPEAWVLPAPFPLSVWQSLVQSSLPNSPIRMGHHSECSTRLLLALHLNYFEKWEGCRD